ncbi:MAG: hypothetical protein KDI41_13860, partial [Pseudomonadales bacterium]|nr:hypothetical protein [Pseudomonadales bacterium]
MVNGRPINKCLCLQHALQHSASPLHQSLPTGSWCNASPDKTSGQRKTSSAKVMSVHVRSVDVKNSCVGN